MSVCHTAKPRGITADDLMKFLVKHFSGQEVYTLRMGNVKVKS